MKIKYILLSAVVFVCSIKAFSQNFQGVSRSVIGEVSVIEVAGNGDTWIGTNGNGLYFYKVSLASWSHYMPDTSSGNLLPSDTITCINISPINSNTAFIGTPHGLAAVSNGAWDSVGHHQGKHIVGVVVRADSVWVVSTDSFAYFDTARANFGAPKGTYTLPAGVSMATCAQVLGTTCAGTWVGTSNRGCFYTDNGTPSAWLDVIPANGSLVDNRVNCVSIDPPCNRKLVGTKGGFSLCPIGHPCQNFTDSSTHHQLPENDITSIEQGCNNTIWLGTRDSGVVAYTSATNAFTRITTANGLTDNHVTSVSTGGPNCSISVGLQDGNIVLIDSNKTVVKILSGINKVEQTSYGVHVFPQPAGNLVNFVFESDLSAELYLTDLSGREIQHLNIKNSSNTILDVSNLAGGMYIYQLVSSGQMLKSGKVLIVK